MTRDLARRGASEEYACFFQAEDGIRDAQESRGLGDVNKRHGCRAADRRSARW